MTVIDPAPPYGEGRRRSAARTLLRPWALLSHGIVLGVVAVLLLLGQWQLERLDQVRTSNALLAERAASAPVDVIDLVTGTAIDEQAVEFRRVSVTGTFRPDEEVLQRNRVQRGLQGLDVLTPLDLGDGLTLLVRRGWVPTTMDTPPLTDAPPPTGLVTVTGILERSVTQPTFGARDPDDGVLQRVFHPDTARLDRQMSGTLLPVVLRMDALPGADATTLPTAPEAPGLDEGSHLSYAAQWHLFALLALGAYVLWWRTRLRRVSTVSG
jgi:surfeit locus 1 family protein